MTIKPFLPGQACPSFPHPSEGGAAPATQSPVPAGAALKVGDRVRMEFGWAEHVDGVLLAYRNDGEAIVRWDDDDCDRIVDPRRLALAPPRNDSFGDNE